MRVVLHAKILKETEAEETCLFCHIFIIGGISETGWGGLRLFYNNINLKQLLPNTRIFMRKKYMSWLVLFYYLLSWRISAHAFFTVDKL